MRFYLARKLPAGYAAVPLPYKLFVLFGVIFIAVLFIYYTQDVVEQLKDKTRRDVKLYVKLYQVALNDQTSGLATNLIFEEVISSVNFPIIFADADLQPQYWKELDGIKDGMASDADSATLSKVRKFLAQLESKEQSVDIISNDRLFYKMFYGDPPLVRQLQLMPVVQVGVISFFIIVGFIGFRNIKRAEQRNIWVGMAKETAHQLGTPLSSLMGWLELLGSREEDKGLSGYDSDSMPTEEILSRMKADIGRLERIASRFSLIGSIPDLTTVDVEEIIEETADYLRQRLPHGGDGVRIEFKRSEPKLVGVNRELLGWAFENLLKNALQACDARTGRIEIKSSFSKDRRKVCIQVSDNGRGMTPKEAKRAFQPGYSTKKRGWGLGLTLTDRIISKYHRGDIFIKESSPGLGTTFQIELPITGADKTQG